MSRCTVKLAVAVYPLVAGATAVNTFLLSLAGHRIGLPVLSTLQSVLLGSIIGVPIAILVARYLRKLMREAISRDA